MRSTETRKGSKRAPVIMLFPLDSDDDQIHGMKVYLRRGTIAEWFNSNPVLADREIVFIEDTDGIKVGDGERTFCELPWWSPEVDDEATDR